MLDEKLLLKMKQIAEKLLSETQESILLANSQNKSIEYAKYITESKFDIQQIINNLRVEDLRQLIKNIYLKHVSLPTANEEFNVICNLSENNNEMQKIYSPDYLHQLQSRLLGAINKEARERTKNNSQLAVECYIYADLLKNINDNRLNEELLSLPLYEKIIEKLEPTERYEVYKYFILSNQRLFQEQLLIHSNSELVIKPAYIYDFSRLLRKIETYNNEKTAENIDYNETINKCDEILQSDNDAHMVNSMIDIINDNYLNNEESFKLDITAKLEIIMLYFASKDNGVKLSSEADEIANKIILEGKNYIETIRNVLSIHVKDDNNPVYISLYNKLNNPNDLVEFFTEEELDVICDLIKDEDNKKLWYQLDNLTYIIFRNIFERNKGNRRSYE